jgi:hypothetical protein
MGWTAAGWRFVVPAEGMRLTLRSSGVEFDFHDGAWLSGPGVVGSATPAIADPLGGITTEVNMWASVAQILSALRGYGLIQT